MTLQNFTFEKEQMNLVKNIIFPLNCIVISFGKKERKKERERRGRGSFVTVRIVSLGYLAKGSRSKQRREIGSYNQGN